MASTSTASALMHSPRWQQFYQLTKPRVVQLIVFCAAIGMALAVPGLPDLSQALTMLAAIAGIWLVAGAAAAFNCLIEDGIDARMKRTAWRATAKGELSRTQTLAFSALLCAAGMALLGLYVNPLTMWLTFATFVGYAVIYTVILKPMTPQNIVIGGASGAMPPVLGCASSSSCGRRRTSGRWRCTAPRTTPAPACRCCPSRMATTTRGCRSSSTPGCCSRPRCCPS
jgi:protoheme IX farnesyltransferase